MRVPAWRHVFILKRHVVSSSGLTHLLQATDGTEMQNQATLWTPVRVARKLWPVATITSRVVASKQWLGSRSILWKTIDDFGDESDSVGNVQKIATQITPMNLWCDLQITCKEKQRRKLLLK